MKININGITREMTAEEIAEMENQVSPINYNEEVDSAIRERYSISQEFAILRQKDSKPEEYAKYYAYCEECKAYVKKMIAEINSSAETPDSVEM